MVSIVDGGVLLDTSSQAPAPSKDYINMKVTMSQFQWRVWKISPQCLKSDIRVAPIETSCSHHDFLHDMELQREVKRIFGENVLTYVKRQCDGKYNFLDRMKRSLQIYIASYLELEDVAHLSQVNKHFKELCDSDQLWEHIVERFCDTVTPDMKLYAQEVGWKQVFFTNKLQLQMQLRRRKQQPDS